MGVQAICPAVAFVCPPVASVFDGEQALANKATEMVDTENTKVRHSMIMYALADQSCFLKLSQHLHAAPTAQIFHHTDPAEELLHESRYSLQE